MRLQDLREEQRNQNPNLDTLGEALARRVAALFDDCPDCEGLGQRGKHPDEVDCPRCGGAGWLLSDKWPGGRDPHLTLISAAALFSVLFADSGVPEGGER
jgi:hypothetical protein